MERYWVHRTILTSEGPFALLLSALKKQLKGKRELILLTIMYVQECNSKTYLANSSFWIDEGKKELNGQTTTLSIVSLSSNVSVALAQNSPISNGDSVTLFILPSSYQLASMATTLHVLPLWLNWKHHCYLSIWDGRSNDNTAQGKQKLLITNKK